MATRDEKLYEGQPAQTAAQPAMTTQQPAAVQQTVSYIDNNGQRQQGVADMSGYYDQARAGYRTMYDEAVAGNNQAAERAAAQAREAAAANRQALDTGYQGTNRQLYRDYMQNQRTLPQQMAARGYTGGLSESAQLRLQNSYEEALAENERSRLGQQASADAALSQRLYEIQAQADSGNREARQQLLAYEQGLRDLQRQEAREDAAYARTLQEQQRQEARQDLQTRATTLAAAGDFSGYADLGYSQAQIDALTRAWLASNPDLTSAWISAHPVDAQRLGISVESTPSYSGGYYPAASGGLRGLAGQLVEAYQGGTDWNTIRETVSDMVDAGEITPQEGNQAIWDARGSGKIPMRELKGHTPGQEPVTGRNQNDGVWSKTWTPIRDR